MEVPEEVGYHGFRASGAASSPRRARSPSGSENQVNPLQIVYAFDNRVPSPQADTEQLVSTVAALSRRDLDLCLLVPDLGGRTSGPELCQYYGVQGRFRVSHFPGIRWARVPQKLWAPVRVARTQEVADADLIYTRNLPIALGSTALGRRVVLDTYRPWPRQYPVLRPLLRWLMRSPSFVGGVLHSELARRAYLEAGIPNERLLVAHNGFEPSRMEPVMAPKEAREKLGLDPDRPTVVYAGRIGGDKGLDVVLETARRCPDVRFLFVGATGRDPFEEECRAVPNIELISWKPFDELSAWLYAADVLLVPPSEEPLLEKGHTVLPMKLFAYMAAGRPILAGASADVRELLVDRENAILVPPGDAGAVTAALTELLADEELRARLARGAARTAGGLTWDARAERIHEFLLERLGEMG